MDLSLRLFPYSARRFEPIDPWQANVEQDDVGAQLRSLVHRFKAIVRNVSVVTTQRQQHGEQLRGVPIVVDHKDTTEKSWARIFRQAAR